MTALREQFQKARAVLQSLVYGLHPVTGVELSKDDIVNSIEANRCRTSLRNTAAQSVQSRGG